MARVHAASLAGDAMVAVALASSLFFDIDPSAARTQILLYLAVTMAPFAVVGPFIGPVLDRARGGRRTALIAINALRVATAFLMLPVLDEVLLFPVAFAHLVLGKSYHVAKASIVPTTVRSDAELVEKNSRLAVLSGVAGFVGAAPAVIAQFLFGPQIAVALAMTTYGVAVFFSWQLPRAEDADGDGGETEAHEMRTSGIALASNAMAILRAIVGFMFWLVAFAFRGGTDDVDLSGVGSSVGAAVRTALGYPAVDESVTAAWKLGVVLAFSAIGTLAGSFIAPRVRERIAEEDMLLGALGLVGVSAAVAAWIGGLNGAGLLALVIGFAGSGAKVAFDAVVQRDAPDANYAQSFARFESKFQIAWVVGALIPVIPPMGIQPRLGFTILAVVALLATVWYYIGTRGDNYGSDEPVGAVVERVRSFLATFRPDADESAETPGETHTKRQSMPAQSSPMTTGEALAIPDWVSGGASPDITGPATAQTEAEPTVAMPAVAEPPTPAEQQPDPDRRSVFDRQRRPAPGDEAMWDDHR